MERPKNVFFFKTQKSNFKKKGKRFNMGHGITVATVLINKKNKTYLTEEVDELYMSYNWASSEYWSVRKDMNGRTGKECTKRIQEALNAMDEAKIAVGVRAVAGGTHKTKDLPEKERKSIFRYHLERFLKAVEKYPDQYFISDCCKQDLDIHGETYTRYFPPLEEDEEDEEDIEGEFVEIKTGKPPVESNEEEEERGRIFVYVMHPVNGGPFKVDTFKKCMMIYGCMKAKDDPRADKWFDLAFKMKGTPS